MIKAATSKPMPALSFLEGERRDAAGRLIGEILALNDDELERRHGFIQWLFALPEPESCPASTRISAGGDNNPIPSAARPYTPL